MAKSIFFFIFPLFFIPSFAQIAFYEDSVAEVVSPPPSFEVVTYNFIKNNSSDTVIYRWRRVVEEIPSTWESAVCDEIACRFPSVNTINDTIKIAPGDSTNLDVHFYNEGRVGEGYVEVIAFDVADSANTVVNAKFYAKAENEDVDVSISRVEKNSFDIYPNPASDAINIKGLENISSNAIIEIYSIIGVKVAEVEYSRNSIDVSAFQSGVYLLKVSDKNKSYSQTFIKQ